MNQFTATPDGKVLMAGFGDGPVDTVEAGLWAAELHQIGERQAAAELRATIRQAQVNRNIRADA